MGMLQTIARSESPACADGKDAAPGQSPRASLHLSFRSAKQDPSVHPNQW